MAKEKKEKEKDKEKEKEPRLPRYRVVSENNARQAEEKINELAELGYRVVALQDQSHWSEQEGHHGSITILMETRGKGRRG